MSGIYCGNDVFCKSDLLAVADEFNEPVSSICIHDKVVFETRDTVEQQFDSEQRPVAVVFASMRIDNLLLDDSCSWHREE